MRPFETMALPVEPTALAPDGSRVRVLLSLGGGSMAHFELPAGATSVAVRHRTVEELWYFLNGEGEMWRSQDGREEIVAVGGGVCVTIPLGTSFQFRAGSANALTAVAVTVPPWPGADEAVLVEGPWRATPEVAP